MPPTLTPVARSYTTIVSFSNVVPYVRPNVHMSRITSTTMSPELSCAR